MRNPNPTTPSEIGNRQPRSNPGFVTPPEEDFRSEVFRGSLQEMLADNTGEFVVIEFLIGTQTIMRKEGIIHTVGRSYIVLYEERTRRFVLCDIFSVKFVTFYPSGERPPANRGMNQV